MQDDFNKPYDPKNVEDKIYKIWEKSGYFNPDNLPIKKGAKPFCIIMPPPNANGSLHLGHAVFVALEDIMTRYQRMQGKKTLWLPGADHAGFETQVVFEKKLEKEGRNRFEITRDELYKETLEFTLKNKKTTEAQLKKLGASCDWSREKFTLDQDIVQIVYKTFKKLYDDGLVYRDARPVNWCTKHQTSLSDLEVKYEERNDPLYYIKYGPLTLATVRLETKFGDTAVAVNPKDERYKKYIGKEIEIETVIGKAKIKVIADEYVDMKFGTGVVKITPAHDPDDFEIGRRHNLEIKEVIDKYGKLNEKAEKYAGMKIMEARAKIAEDMKTKGLIEKIDENYTHTVGHCYKCGNIIEPRIMPQWFIAVNKKGVKSGKILAKNATAEVKKGKIKFVSKRFEKIFFHWMKNIRDWNISRQIVWGIRIPAWFHESQCIPRKNQEKDTGKCEQIIISDTEPKCKFCDAKFIQDNDVFDTWFSSGQWPFASLMANKSNDFKNFYPTSVMETGWDILFFWVARMIMLSIYSTGKAPFKNIYLHGLVRDKDRQKMSKSKGNVTDPLAVISEHGADALRMSLIFGTGTGNDVIISEDKIVTQKRFANKIWNASRFVLINIGEKFNQELSAKIKLSKEDKLVLNKLKKTTKKVTVNIEKFRFHEAAQEIYHFFWHEFCDKYIEVAKLQLKEDVKEKSTKLVLSQVLTTSLKLLHPFMPFITEEIWEKLPHTKKNLLMIERWPK
ncbi:MAG: valine--tRNA ligase [bacterium]|nr:valine--tRNA ligase [bacterium]